MKPALRLLALGLLWIIVLSCKSNPGSGGPDGSGGELCGNGAVDPEERCDTAIAEGEDGVCPTGCDDKNACTDDAVSDPGTCGASCTSTPVTICRSGDGCCPKGCAWAGDNDCSVSCGNGTVEPPEKCDPAIKAGSPGACPESCDDKDACTKDVLLNEGTCDAGCTSSPVTACVSGDGCCPKGCTAATDQECSASCGNGVVEPPEKCDTGINAGSAGACPQSCDDKNPCTKDVLQGGGTCNATCSSSPVTACVSGDGCCPSGCTTLADADCKASCGNGVVEPPEKCDTGIKAGSAGACPQSCDDKNPCTSDQLLDGGTCNASCVQTPIAGCKAGESCAAPLPLVFSLGGQGGTAAATGDTSLFADDASSPSCGGAGNPDLVYTFTTTVPLNLTVNVSPLAPALKPVLSLRGASCSGTELACKKGSLSFGALLTSPNLPAGTYHLWVDSDAGKGAFILNATLSPVAPASSTCASPRPLWFSNGSLGGVAMDNDSTAQGTNSPSSSCGGDAKDIVYTFTTTKPFDLAVSVTGSGGFKPRAYLMAGCAGQTFVCSETLPGGAANIELGSLPAGTYNLFVDGFSGSVGPYLLIARLDPVKSTDGESCLSPKPIIFSSGDHGTFTDSSFAAAHSDNYGGCGWTPSGPDVVYIFTTTVPRNFSATMVPSAGLGPALSLNTNCAGHWDLCDYQNSGKTASISKNPLPPGTYYLWADQQPWVGGSWTLNVSLQ